MRIDIVLLEIVGKREVYQIWKHRTPEESASLKTRCSHGQRMFTQTVVAPHLLRESCALYQKTAQTKDGTMIR